MTRTNGMAGPRYGMEEPDAAFDRREAALLADAIPEQKISSRQTSVNTVPALFKSRAFMAARTGRNLGHRSHTSARLQANMRESPIMGMYVYRSARAWAPTWMIPITGRTVIRYQNQPTAR